jgi:SAM-dependent methyltransferase
MNPGALPPVRPSDLAGETLYGNDFDDAALRAWLADDERGYFDLHDRGEGAADVADDHRAMNEAHGALLRDRRYPVALLLGCADGSDFLGLGIEAERLIAIEPARDWWRDRIGDVPAEFRAPTVSGDIDLPDHSVDLVVCLGVLHHVANVEHVIAELARVLKPGGRMMVREPIISMGDFRAPRPGLTLHERGIPRRLMRAFHERAGLAVKIERPCSSQLVRLGMRKLGIDAYVHAWGVALDRFVSRATMPMTPYWRARPWHKLGPVSVLLVSEKAGSA